jgi:hypothetical protein
MAFTPLLPRLLDGLFNGNRIGNPLQNAANPLEDATSGNGDDAPSGDDFLRTLPPGIERQMQMRGLDGLPPGLARQLVPGSPPPPADKPAPGANGSSNVPNLPGPPAPSSGPSTPQGTPNGAWTTQITAAIANAFAQRPGPSQPSAAPAGNGVPGNPNAAQRANGAPAAAANAPAAAPPSSLAAAPAQAASPALQATQAAQLALAQASPPALRAAAATASPMGAVSAGTAAAAASAPGTTSQTAAPTAARAPDGLVQARTDMAPPPARAEQGVLDRLAGLLRPAGDMARIVLPAVVARDAALAAHAMGSTTSPAPVSAPAPQTLGDARPMGVTGNERAGMVRSDVVMTPAFTGTGPARRGGRLDAFQSRLKQGHDALDAEGDTAASRREARADKEGWFALQWMFWVLAIVAYGCLALALIAFLPATSALSIDIDRVHPWASTIVLLTGLVTAAAAWWLARRLMRK